MSRTYDQMRQLWSRHASSFHCEVRESDVEEGSYLVRGKPANKKQDIVFIDGNGETPVRMTRFWFDDGTTDDLIFTLRLENTDYILSDW